MTYPTFLTTDTSIFRFDAELDALVATPVQITNTGVVQWTSLPGSVTGERTGTG